MSISSKLDLHLKPGGFSSNLYVAKSSAEGSALAIHPSVTAPMAPEYSFAKSQKINFAGGLHDLSSPYNFAIANTL
jgi:hypothetical protein